MILDWLKELDPVRIILFVMVFLLLGLVYGLARSRNRYKKRLIDLEIKSLLEQQLEFATLDQLMAEINTRCPGYLMVLPTNEPGEPGIRIYLKGIPEASACELMRDVIQIISTQPPTNKS